MKLLYSTAPLLLALSLAACNKPEPAAAPATPTDEATTAGKHDATTQTTGVGEATAKLDAGAVWTGSLEACRQANNGADTCLIDTLRSAGASPSALAAARTLSEQGKPGYVSAWQSTEGVGVATLEFPFRANTNQGTWLVDSTGKTVDVDENLLDEPMRNNADYKAFHDKHPEANPFAPAVAAGSDTRPDGGVRLRYTTPMRTCHACADEGKLTIGYNFDGQRKYLGKELVELR